MHCSEMSKQAKKVLNTKKNIVFLIFKLGEEFFENRHPWCLCEPVRKRTMVRTIFQFFISAITSDLLWFRTCLSTEKYAENIDLPYCTVSAAESNFRWWYRWKEVSKSTVVSTVVKIVHFDSVGRSFWWFFKCSCSGVKHWQDNP